MEDKMNWSEYKITDKLIKKIYGPFWNIIMLSYSCRNMFHGILLFTGIGSILETLYTVHMARQYNGYLAYICMTPKIYNSMNVGTL